MKRGRQWKRSMLLSLMMLGASAAAAQADTNVAIGKSVTASKAGSSVPASNAVDGNAATRWSSGSATEAWIRVDLAGIYNLSQVVLKWEAGYSKSYQIELSNDDINWVSVYSDPSGNGGDDTINLTGNTFGSARYVRMKSTSAYNSGWGVSLWEFEIYGAPDNAPFVTVDPGLTLVRLPINSITPDATVTDIDSTSFTYSWTQVSGPATASFGGTNTLQDPTITFPAVRGWYVFQIIARDDSGHYSKPVQVTVRLLDPAFDDKLLAHWTFNEGSGSIAHDIAGFDDKGLLGHHNEVGGALHHDPNWVTGWIPGDSNNYALDFTDLGYVEVTPDPVSTDDPNIANLDYGLTVACWVNARDWDGNRRIIQYGLGTSDEQNIFRLLYENGSLKFVPDRNASGYTSRQVSTSVFTAGEWHHVAGTYDGKTVSLYVDGVLATSAEYASYQALTAYVGQTVSIGCKNKDVPERYAGDYMNGQLDDVRLYNFALSHDAVVDLVKLGQNAAPVINNISLTDIGPGNVIMLTGPTTVSVDADIYDANDDVISYNWTQISPETPLVAFSDVNVEDPQITFAEVGVYKFRLTITDGTFGLADTIYKEITVTVNQADCARVLSDGLGLIGDLNADCYVDLLDFAMLASDWLKCNDPADTNCSNPYEL